MTVGAPGGWSISSAVAQAMSNVIDFGMSPAEAVDAPRFHTEGVPTYAELRVPQKTIAHLRGRGMRVEQSLLKLERRFAKVQMALVDGDRFRGGTDPRGDSGSIGIARA
jgi:gamma-glutamyltranspeptidase/glutathione hydrolase